MVIEFKWPEFEHPVCPLQRDLIQFSMSDNGSPSELIHEIVNHYSPSYAAFTFQKAWLDFFLSLISYYIQLSAAG